jgi:hypothetical protein
MKKSQLRKIIKEEISKVFNEADYKYKNYVASAFDKINDAMFEFRHSMGLKQLTNKDMDLKRKVESLQQGIFDLQKEMKSKGLAESRKSVFDGEKIGFENIILIIQKEIDALELGVEDGNEYLDKMIKELEELKIYEKDFPKTK